ncbi:pyrroline-5-carboxylate reductase [Clostridium sp. AF19-22AC]|jgi:pyrroline-5-carboxylate reductase|uniref:pyrroline-5-carboxylate reductase n=1 Tax=Clostridia TaxID=186801 RepID=UPI000E516F93|nr:MULTISPECIES: pyrroline-5-carboxylate reductase [Clostridia]RHR32957.1 pyrroline-5-carboxylate reductase [Clostridium sp. AF19-22AC]
MKKIGFIGCGNMGRAIIRGIIQGGVFEPDEIIVSDSAKEAVQSLKQCFKVTEAPDNQTLAAQAEIILLAVKPQIYQTVIEQIRETVTEDQMIITIAAGWTIKRLEHAFDRPVKIIRCMPNTPALIGAGVTSVCANDLVTRNDFTKILTILESFGLAKVIPENLFDAASALSGCSPACIFMLIEAMADAAVYSGIPRQEAYDMAAQTLVGSARMVLETNKHPADLKDMVCTPGGSTIEAVRVLEEKGFRSAMFQAMLACAEKSGNL